MTEVVVVGAGMMGSAFCCPLLSRGHRVNLVGTPLDLDVVREWRESGAHPRLGVPLRGDLHLFGHEDLPRALSAAKCVVLGVSSAGTSWAASALAAPFAARPLPVLSLSKGLSLCGGAVEPLTDLFERRLRELGGRLDAPTAAISGPCIAGELARGVPTVVAISSRDPRAARVLAELAATDDYRLVPVRDHVGAQVCAALKNAYALAVGFAAGQHEQSGGHAGSVARHNCEASAFAQALIEMQALVRASGGEDETALGLSGSGDLTVTCNGGRTGRFGALLGRGLSLEEATSAMEGATLECVEVLEVVRQALEAGAFGSLGLKRLPLLRHLFEVALDGHPVGLPFEEFFQR